MKCLILVCLLVSIDVFSAGWIQKSDFGGVARHRTPMVAINNKIYTGLGHYNGAGPNIIFSDWWEYDPSTNAWTQKADYLGGICYHGVAFSHGAAGYVGTGRTSPTGNTLVSAFFKYTPATNSWVAIASIPGPGRRGAVAFTIGQYSYVGTGESTSGSLSDFYRFDSSTETWIQLPNFPGNARNSSVAFSDGSFGYMGTGNTNFGSTNDFWKFDPSTFIWTSMSPVGPTNRQEATGFALNGKGYIGTGDDFSSGNNFSDFWEFDFATNTWTQIDDFKGTSRRYLAAAVLNGVAYAGLGTNGTNFKDFWVFDQTLAILENEINKLELRTYPNPAYDEINVLVPSHLVFEGLQIDIYDLKANVIMKVEIQLESTIINLDNLPSGEYLVCLKYKETQIKNVKVMKL
jgi:N-acetylneuraminic acid mutarotase